MILKDVCEEFIIYIKSVRGLSENTVTGYTKDLEHLCEILFQRDCCGLLIVGAGSDAHGQRDTVSIHEKPHLDQRSRLVLLGRTILAQSFDRFAGHFVYVIIIVCFNFKVIIRAVIEADGSITFYNVAAFLKEMADVFIIVLL